MSQETIIRLVHDFSEIAVSALIVLLAFLVLLGLANAVYVIYLTLGARTARRNGATGTGAPLPVGFISMYTYLHLVADVLLVVVGIELIETLVAFLAREDPEAYLTGVVGAALVALARRVIVFFNPESEEVRVGEMYAYAALVAAFAAAYALILYGA